MDGCAGCCAGLTLRGVDAAVLHAHPTGMGSTRLPASASRRIGAPARAERSRRGPASLTQEERLLELQASAGNRAVTEMLAGTSVQLHVGPTLDEEVTSEAASEAAPEAVAFEAAPENEQGPTIEPAPGTGTGSPAPAAGTAPAPAPPSRKDQVEAQMKTTDSG